MMIEKRKTREMAMNLKDVHSMTFVAYQTPKYRFYVAMIRLWYPMNCKGCVCWQD
jgi:hypothetical protein